MPEAENNSPYIEDREFPDFAIKALQAGFAFAEWLHAEREKLGLSKRLGGFVTELTTAVGSGKLQPVSEQDNPLQNAR